MYDMYPDFSEPTAATDEAVREGLQAAFDRPSAERAGLARQAAPAEES
ncbi:MAG: hypothetical protein QM638_12415 [Nocardioides sp.]